MNPHILQVQGSIYPLTSDESPFANKVTYAQISKVLKIGMLTIDRTKKKVVEGDFDASLERRPTQREYERKADGDFEANLIALCCSEPPKEYARWSLRLIADKVVELK